MGIKEEISQMIDPRALDFVESTIMSMDSRALKQMMGGYGDDLDALLMDIVVESHKVYNEGLGGRTPGENFGLESVAYTYEETMRREDINYFAASVLPPEMFSMNWHHVEWGRIINTYRRIFLLAARGHGKSWFFTVLFSIWKMYRHDKNVAKWNHSHIYHFTHTVTFGEELLVNIKAFIEAVPIIKERLHNPSVRNWKKAELWTANGCHWQTEGFWSASRGPHPQTIIVDDPFKEDVAFSPTKRSRGNKIFFNTIIPMLERGGQMVCVGTPLIDGDLYSEVKKSPDKRSMFAYFEYPAIFPDGRLLWQDKFDYKALMDQQKIQGSLYFSREYLCRTISGASSMFPYEKLNNALIGMENYTLVNNREASPKRFSWIVGGCDNAKSANIGADYSFYTVWGIEDNGDMWLLNAWINKGATFKEQIAKIKALNFAFNFDAVVVEANNFQSIYTEELMDSSSVPVIPHTTGNEKKDFVVGLPSMTIMFENVKIHLPYGDEASREVADRIMAEFNSITFTDKGKLESVLGHDDGAMSTWFGKIARDHVLSGGAFNFGWMDM